MQIKMTIKIYTVKFQGLSGSAQRRSKRTPVGICLKKNSIMSENEPNSLDLNEK